MLWSTISVYQSSEIANLVFQYRGRELSTSSAHASIPPAIFATRENPCPARNVATLALRPPEWQITATGLSALISRCRDSISASGIATHCGSDAISISQGSRTSRSCQDSSASRCATNSAGEMSSYKVLAPIRYRSSILLLDAFARQAVSIQKEKADSSAMFSSAGISVSNRFFCCRSSSALRVIRRALISGDSPTTRNSRPPGFSSFTKR